ncbi:uncharacterized protein PV09_03661 [Verruconis gallopava]|uniref:HhH-GPD domain-containing protein n=1 Tax=Verruconis gallopava TaxID=253628 RepID=A0A0D2B1A8_9PEZI|nr:uncharacterized protein PV09_03661 [Verruconis gallopava]KIW05104.1 hypothetical protein PV09_03661 [Verruconis gallopava]
MAITRSSRNARNATAIVTAVAGSSRANGLTEESATRVRKRASRLSGENPQIKASKTLPRPLVKRPQRPVDRASIAAPDLTPTSSPVNPTTHPSTHLAPMQTKPRRAALHATNAPLQTPKGSRIVKYPSDTLQHVDSKDSKDIITTNNLLEKACEHLCRVDSRLKPIIDAHYCKLFSPEGLAEDVEPFQALVSGIIAQQVSGAAAASIKRKFIDLFSAPATHEADAVEPAAAERIAKDFPTPQEVVEKDIPTLRSAGLSQRKAEYIHGLAEKFVSGELSAKMLVEASDEEVLEKLVAVRGLGRWSVEMFACFALKRTDIFSTGDLGVQRGMAAYQGKDVAKLKSKGGKWKYMTEAEMLSIAAPFSPFRSIFMWYMWRVEDVNLNALS